MFHCVLAELVAAQRAHDPVAVPSVASMLLGLERVLELKAKGSVITCVQRADGLQSVASRR
eukprot:4033738-Pyramimonas_sp.AAC.1